MSLRARLLVGLVVLVAAGLIATDAATYTFLRSFLNQRVDQQLDAARFPISGALARDMRESVFGPGDFRRGGGPPRGGPHGEGGPEGLRPDVEPSVPSGTYGQLRDSTGGTVLAETILGVATALEPTLPERVSTDETWTARAEGDESERFRVRTSSTATGYILVVAIPLRELSQTLRRLLGVEVAVTFGVLVSLGVLAWWVVRLGLRPLERIGDTASEIAAGDLSKRVERAESRTEVGRLGLALNAMLSQIEQAFADRKASEERLRRFLADASHELRTPLTSIRGYSELFRRGADARPADLAKAMSRIEQESARMGVLVEDLLLLARLDQGRPLEREPVDLAALALDAVEDAKAIDPDRPISFASAEPVVVSGDEIRLRQVAANLLANALAHTLGGSRIDVAVSRNDSYAVLEVADHGPGLAPEDAERVFERFYRSDPSRTRESGGVGLGLSIVAAIAEAHGGSVSVDTAPGEGATFRVSVPLNYP